MIHLHGTVRINQHQRPRLIVVRERKRNPELHRRHREPAFHAPTLRIPRRNRATPLRETRIG